MVYRPTVKQYRYTLMVQVTGTFLIMTEKNQHFRVRFGVGGEGVIKKRTL